MTDTETNPRAGSDHHDLQAPAVTMYMTGWCGFCARLTRALHSEGIEFTEVNIDEVEGAAEIVMARNGGNRTVPTLVFADGVSLTNPGVAEVKEQLARR